MPYPTLAICHALLFPLIRKDMSVYEPAPDYASERRGLDHLESIFSLMQRDEYAGVMAKASYLFCSVIDGHPFSNGNKRLAVALLTFFLLSNGYRISAPDLEVMRQELERVFPRLQWEEVHSFQHPHEYFFYHLALIIADRHQKGAITFQQEQHAVESLLKVITVTPEA